MSTRLEAGAVHGDTIRVLHVVPSLLGGGMERALLRLLANPPERTTHGLCVLQDGDTYLVDQARTALDSNPKPGERAISRMRILRSSGRKAARQLRGMIGEFRPQIVHARTTAAWFDAALACRGLRDVRLLLSFHGLTTLETPGLVRRLVNRCAARRADAVLALSQHAADMLRERYGVRRAKLRVIQNGVDTERFRPAASPEEVVRTRRELELTEAEFVAICVANLQPIKAVDVLLRAWRIAVSHPAKHEKHRRVLLVVGSGPERQRLKSLAQELALGDSVRFLGRREDVPDLLRASDLFVLSSRYECSSNALLEAMATGLPIIATATGGNGELIATGSNGWLVAPGRWDLLAERIAAVMNDPASARGIGRAARDAALSLHSYKASQRAYAALYGELAAESPHAGAMPLLGGAACAG